MFLLQAIDYTEGMVKRFLHICDVVNYSSLHIIIVCITQNRRHIFKHILSYCFQSSDKLETNIAKGLIISVKLTGILLIAFFVFCLQAFISEFSKERPCVLTRSYLQVNCLINK